MDQFWAIVNNALQQILVRKGFLDADGNPVPAAVLVARKAQAELEFIDDVTPAAAPVSLAKPHGQEFGKKCGKCGAHAVVPRDGCEHCTACHAIGSCG